MANYARIDGNGVVIETFSHPALAPSDVHAPALAAQFIACPANVLALWKKSGSTWTAPPSSPAAPAVLPLLDPMTFYTAFTPAERIAIKGSADAQVKEFWLTYEMAAQLRHQIDPNLSSVQSSLAYLVAPAAILSSTTRVTQILNGVPQ